MNENEMIYTTDDQIDDEVDKHFTAQKELLMGGANIEAEEDAIDGLMDAEEEERLGAEALGELEMELAESSDPEDDDEFDDDIDVEYYDENEEE